VAWVARAARLLARCELRGLCCLARAAVARALSASAARAHAEPPAEPPLLRAFARARAVIAFRVAPKQKASLVALAELVCGLPPEGGGARGAGALARARVLAIGDGGNDVAMLQRAHVGVGLEGREGLQAARASDVSLGAFRLLPRLLLVHGRLSARRTSFIVHYCIYKSFVICLLQLGFAQPSGARGAAAARAARAPTCPGARRRSQPRASASARALPSAPPPLSLSLSLSLSFSLFPRARGPRCRQASRARPCSTRFASWATTSSSRGSR
jgi:hypothetical protein